MKIMFPSVFVLSFVLTQQSVVYAAPQTETPLYQVTVVQNAAKAINYRNLRGSVEIDFKGTVLLPGATGEAEIKNKRGVLRVEAQFENLSSPNQFGREYLTYIFWGISPEGNATNLGELIIDDGEAEINTQIPLQALTLLVTAEPYFAVSQPSNVVILENAIKPGNKDKIELIDANYELLPRGDYTKNIAATNQPVEAMDKKTPFNVYQARNAVRIAQAAGAETYAADGFKNAERLLALSETKAGGKRGRSKNARQAVQMAEDSRLLSVKLQEEERVVNAQQATQARVASAKNQVAAATAGQIQAETAQRLAEADAKLARASAVQAEGDKAVLRAQLLGQLNTILQTRDTARGLIVNMSDTLFQTGSATLAPPVREKLAKMAGIVASHPGLELLVEGHTDNVGSNASNQRLSEQRAQAVIDYLVKQGVSANSITSQGFGETTPLASNDTSQGRSQNRRVEMIVSGSPIQTMAKAQ